MKGEVRLRAFTDEPDSIFQFGPLLDGIGRIVLTPGKWRAHEGGFVVTPNETKAREFWDGLKGLKLHVPRASLPALDEGEYYYEDLIGLQVVHKDGRKLGKVIAVHNFGASDLLEIAATPGVDGAWFLPYAEDFETSVDIQAGTILADAPEAYLPFDGTEAASDDASDEAGDEDTDFDLGDRDLAVDRLGDDDEEEDSDLLEDEFDEEIDEEDLDEEAWEEAEEVLYGEDAELDPAIEAPKPVASKAKKAPAAAKSEPKVAAKKAASGAGAKKPASGAGAKKPAKAVAADGDKPKRTRKKAD